MCVILKTLWFAVLLISCLPVLHLVFAKIADLHKPLFTEAEIPGFLVSLLE